MEVGDIAMDSPWPCRQMGSQPRLPFPGRKAVSGPLSRERALSSPDLSAVKSVNLENASKEDVRQYLASLISFHPGLLEDYVVANVRSENISRWLTKRQHQEQKTSQDAKHNGDPDSSPEEPKQEFKVVNKVESGDYLPPLYSLSSKLCQVTHSSGFNLYGIGGIGKTLVMYNPEIPMWDPSQSGQRSFLISKKTTVSGHVALTKTPVSIEDVHMDSRFPKRIGADDSSANGIAVLCVPIILPNADLVAVVEFYRSWHDAGYTTSDLHIVQAVLDWAAIAIHKSAVCSSLHQQTEMNDFLLEVSRTYLDDITDINTIIEHIMRFAKTLVSADRCTLFLYDKEKQELYSDLFDNGQEEYEKAIFEKRAEIRFHVSKGIAGHVASTKTVLNIPDAYADSRFNREVDKVTGYTTNNILCFPIMSENEVYGVVQMINKKTGGAFTKLDEENFTMFAIFCALALRYSRIHMKLESEHNSHEIVLEQFKHSMAASEDETNMLSNQITQARLTEPPVDFDRFQFCVIPYDNELPAFFVHMLHDTCLPDYVLPPSDLARFTLTVKRNYRNQPYHNWKHAVTVAHAMYCILKRNSVFTKLEALALIVACLAHDIDHRALSNQYLQKIEHPLAALYPTSTMERHHFEMLYLIIHQEGHRIFSHLDAESYEFVMDLMKHAILATDLALFFGNHRVLNDLLSAGELDVGNLAHRRAIIGLMMTACDLSSTAKTWEPTKSTVYDLYKEFWNEGDLRKKHGFTFVPMMDRDLEGDLPDGQVGFYTNVSIRCYETLAEILQDCDEMLILSKANLERWKKEADAIKERKKSLDEQAVLVAGENDKKGELGVMLRGGMWVIEQSRLENEKKDS